MVRLLPNIPRWTVVASVSFQSHNGAIAARRHYFQVLIEAKISIPQWCDCCHGVSSRGISFGHDFNPTMVRLLQRGVKPLWAEMEHFNPTMVRLLLGACVSKVSDLRDFNPTMVRLLQGITLM